MTADYHTIKYQLCRKEVISGSSFPYFYYYISQILFAQPALRPFPQHAVYFKGVITPGHISSGEMDDSVRSFYFQWKNRYIRKSQCSDAYYVWSENSGKNHECVSEGQGYGMIIVALMAGADSLSQSTFDGLLKYYLEHPSKRSKALMSWAQRSVCGHDEESSASDGDIDIAYSLLLADAQWSSHGNINYALKAKSIISAVLDQEINAKTYSVLESNSIESDSRDYFDMRSSDFIPSEFRSFYKATKKRPGSEPSTAVINYSAISNKNTARMPDWFLILFRPSTKIRGLLKNTIWKVNMMVYTIITPAGCPGGSLRII